MAQLARIIVLVGAKGSGKTTLGRFLEAEPGVHFLEVEAIAKRVLVEMGGVIDERYARRAFEAIASEVGAISTQHRVIVIETTGASEETPSFLSALRRRHELFLVRVLAGAETCARRIRERDPARQVDVSLDLIHTMHERTESLNLSWDLELDNDLPLSRERLLEAVRDLLSGGLTGVK